MEWTSEGVEGSFRIINRLIRLKEKIKNETKPIQENKIHSTIKKVSENIENFEYPKAIISMTDCLDSLSESISKQNYEILLKLFHPFCPHITEELWHDLGNKTFISLEKWPKVDNSKINENLEKQEQAIEKTIQDINNIIKIMKEKKQAPKKVYLYTIPNELNIYKDNLPKLQKSINIPISLFAVNDKNKFDPQNKAGKAKPGKPAIYLE
jgi:leucyl-tRNA synthetase